MHQYDTLFPALAALHPPRMPNGEHPQVVAFHADAHQHREAVDATARIMAMMPDTSAQLQSAFGKWPGLFARLALTFHLIEIANANAIGAAAPYPMVISEETAHRTAAFMHDILLPHLLRAHRLMYSTAQTGHAQWIAGYILAERYERITTRDVVRAYGALRAPEARDELADTMASLVTIGWLEPETPANLMKPVNAWTVNPAVHVLFAERAQCEKTRRAKVKEDIATYVAELHRKKTRH